MAGQNDKEVDFSNFFRNQQKNSSNKAQAKSKPVAKKSGNVRLVILVIIMLGLAGALGYVLYQNSQDKVVKIPAGYHLVAPPNQPAHLEKIQ